MISKKTVLGAIAAFIIIVAGALYWVYSSLDSLALAAIEKYGPEITQVSVTVGAVQLAPTSGEGEIRGLRLGNPKGFKTESALKVGVIRLRMDPASITRDVVVIHEVVIQSPEVSYETGAAGNNLEAIQKNIEAYVARFGGGKKDDAAPKKKMLIENLYIRDARVNVNTALTIGKTVSTPVPDLHLRDIGKRDKGATAGEVTRQVWDALLRSTGGAVSKLGSAIGEGAKSAVDSVKKLFK